MDEDDRGWEGFTTAEAVAWVRAGFHTSADAEVWRAHGFRPGDARAWVDSGTNPRRAASLAQRGITASEARFDADEGRSGTSRGVDESSANDSSSTTARVSRDVGLPTPPPDRPPFLYWDSSHRHVPRGTPYATLEDRKLFARHLSALGFAFSWKGSRLYVRAEDGWAVARELEGFTAPILGMGWRSDPLPFAVRWSTSYHAPGWWKASDGKWYPGHLRGLAPPASSPNSGSTNGLAIASLVLGILFLCGIGSILALVFGYRARRQIRESGQGGAGMATAGIVLGWIEIGLGVAGLLIALGMHAHSSSSGTAIGFPVS